MNPLLIQGALGMLARLIPPEEYAKATGSLNELVLLARSIDERMKRIEAIVGRVDMLEAAASTDSPAFRMGQAEQAMYMVPGTIEEALSPSKGGSDGRRSEGG